MSKEIPKSVRIRTGEGNEYRYDAIQQAATHYGVNKSDAVAYACEDAVKLRKAARQLLEREDLSLSIEERQEIAELFSVGSRKVDPFPFVDVDE
ncbi:DUF7692 domain-containing protein [Haloarchaeobius sp. TZWWS8]|uniref:DUF7692 domain-containing protein n=1 Tax=Haloarchaeobius sp. TZWWS8 TaxID=3446121 RepID=UPI003EBC5C6E